MYIDYQGSKQGGPYPKREDISLLDFGQSGYFCQVITVHRYAKKLDVLAFLNSSDLYIYAKCLKKEGLLLQKRRNSCFKFAAKWLFQAGRYSMWEYKNAENSCFPKFLSLVHLCKLPKKGRLLLQKGRNYLFNFASKWLFLLSSYSMGK